MITKKLKHWCLISICASFEQIHGEKKLVYTYFNMPIIKHRAKSPIHIGTTIVSVENVNKLVGEYYTDRTTKGDLIAQAIINKKSVL